MKISRKGVIKATGKSFAAAQWVIESTNQIGVIRLKNVKHQQYLVCDTPETLSAKNSGKEETEFWVRKHGKKTGKRVYSFESVKNGFLIGFRQDGSQLPVAQVTDWIEGSFEVNVK